MTNHTPHVPGNIFLWSRVALTIGDDKRACLLQIHITEFLREPMSSWTAFKGLNSESRQGSKLVLPINGHFKSLAKLWHNDLDNQARVFSRPFLSLFPTGKGYFFPLVFSFHPFKPIHLFLATFAFACPGIQLEFNFVQTEDGKISSDNALLHLFFCSKYSLNIILPIVYTNSFKK